MLRFLEGSRAIAQTIKLCRPNVVAVYPITPQTHIIENLAKFKVEEQADYEYIKTESEMAAASAVLGASAAGARVYTASASQGLLLMTEVLFNIAGLRLPVVLTCANRAISAPINIWNDEQDAMTMRDAGWIMLFAESNQEAVDLHIQAYKIAEATNLPVMVCVDGFSLTHTFEPMEIYDQKLVDKFLPFRSPTPISNRSRTPVNYLDAKNPVTLGGLSNPENYSLLRKKLHQDLLASKKTIQKTSLEFNKLFKHPNNPKNLKNPNNLIDYSGSKNPKLLLVAMGSVLGTIRETIWSSEASRKRFAPKSKIGNGKSAIENVGLLKITCFRPFPAEEISQIILKTKPKTVAVIDRAVSLGHGGILFTEIKQTCYNKIKTKIKNFIFGLGGKDITPRDIEKILKNL
jgi:pyruvate ferredoxin oxidoreductase alpha subunit